MHTLDQNYRLFHRKIKNKTTSNSLTDSAFFVYIKIYLNLKINEKFLTPSHK